MIAARSAAAPLTSAIAEVQPADQTETPMATTVVPTSVTIAAATASKVAPATVILECTSAESKSATVSTIRISENENVTTLPTKRKTVPPTHLSDFLVGSRMWRKTRRKTNRRSYLRNVPHSVEAVRKMKESQLQREKMKGNVNERDKVRRREDTRKPQPNLETVVHSRPPGRDKCREHSSTPKHTKLQIGQLSRNVTREHIFEIFKAFENIKSVEFPMDKLHPGCGTGSAYIEYATLAEAQRAMKHMVGGQIDGQQITAALVLMPPKPRPPPPHPSPPRRPVHCISFSHLHHHNIGEVCIVGDLIAPDLVVEHLFIKGGTVIQAPVIHTDFACEEPLSLHTD
ncbi:uncharacterized protein LOC126297948 [Schistocerca gregaria]|uniref:uncharacterized protein LOC126297948 n=1 Tax=Schistocerca gregaria TaxID=7010 RepID=UPI00211EF4DB|nr:uncharacterized protein LOC126297948 [Schistocerca gregaria]